MYTEKVMDHFQHPRNVGEIENASGVVPYSEKVLGSDKSVVNSDNFARQELLRGAGNGYGDEAEPEPSGLQDMQEVESGLFCLDGEGWMIMDYPDSKTLARVILKLNLPELYRSGSFREQIRSSFGLDYEKST